MRTRVQECEGDNSWNAKAEDALTTTFRTGRISRKNIMLCVAFSAAAFTPQTSLLHARPHHRMTSPLLVDTDEKPSGGFSLPTFFQPDVPEDQQAVSELTNLKAQFAGDWPSTDAYNGKLITLYAGLTLFISLPVSYTTFYVLPDEIPQLLIASNFGTFAAMLLFVLKLRLDWGGLSKRLASRTLYFEADQTGQQAKKDKAVSSQRTALCPLLCSTLCPFPPGSPPVSPHGSL